MGGLVGGQPATGRVGTGVGSDPRQRRGDAREVAEGRAVCIVPTSMASFYGGRDLHGQQTRKSRNIAAGPRCVVSIATHPFDLVIGGSAIARHPYRGTQSVAAAFVEQGWPARSRATP